MACKREKANAKKEDDDGFGMEGNIKITTMR